MVTASRLPETLNSFPFNPLAAISPELIPLILKPSCSLCVYVYRLNEMQWSVSSNLNSIASALLFCSLHLAIKLANPCFIVLIEYLIC